MKLEVKLYARAKEIAGADRLELDVAERTASAGKVAIADVRRALAEQVPGLASLVSAMLFAVGTDYADDTTLVGPGTPVACFPPVSGGC